MLFCHAITTRIGSLGLIADSHCLLGVLLPRHGAAQPIDPSWQRLQTPVLRRASREFRAWFRDPHHRFELPLPPPQRLGTPFQRRVWLAISAIPCGASTTYGDLAREIGTPRAARAVGAACAANPLPLIVPCHRVLRADGGETGFNGGDPGTQMALLDFEAGQ